jgi:hypothetical protein
MSRASERGGLERAAGTAASGRRVPPPNQEKLHKEDPIMRRFVSTLLILQPTLVFAQQPDTVSAIGKRFEAIESAISAANSRMQTAVEDYNRIKTVLSDYQMLDGHISNYLTLLSIIAAIIVVAV